MKKNSFSFLINLIILLSAPFLTMAQEKNAIPDYRDSQRSQIPVEYTWKVEDVYPTLDAWKKDKEEAITLTAKIDELKKGWTKSPQKILEMFQLIDKISIKSDRLRLYAKFQRDVDFGNSFYQNLLGDAEGFRTNLRTKIAFIADDILKVKKETLLKYFNQEPLLSPYRFQIEKILRSEKHILPEEREKIVSTSAMFGNNFETACGLMNYVEIPSPEIIISDGQKINMSEANYYYYRSTKNPADELVQKTYWENHARYENTQAVLFDGAMKYFTFLARVHNFNTGLESQLFENNIDTSVYHQLIRTTKANLAPYHRYIKLKKELLKLNKIHFGDMYTSSVSAIDRVYPYNEASAILLEVIKPLGKEYGELFKTALENRWIDIYPNKNKETGAYQEGLYGIHSYLKMNYNGRYYDVSTLAHELGHAMHSELVNRTQPYSNSNYSTFLAEIASTFNENLLFEYMLSKEKDDLMRLYFIDNYLEQAFNTIYRQTYFAEFELAMHTQAEQGNTLTAEWLSKTYLDIIKVYYGHDQGVLEIDDFLKNAWSQIPHFFMNYYVYQYATSMIASITLTEDVLKNGAKARDNYINLLKSGGSDHPVKLLKNASVDLTSTEPGQAAFKRLDELVAEMEKITDRLKKNGKL